MMMWIRNRIGITHAKFSFTC